MDDGELLIAEASLWIGGEPKFAFGKLEHLLTLPGGALGVEKLKAKIHNLMSVLSNHAICQEWLEQGRNSILLVPQSAKWQNISEWLEPEEVRALLLQLDRCFRVMVFLDAATGLRRCEFLALNWDDVEFDNLQINVRRSIYWNIEIHIHPTFPDITPRVGRRSAILRPAGMAV